jgi:hypothetical protein
MERVTESDLHWLRGACVCFRALKPAASNLPLVDVRFGFGSENSRISEHSAAFSNQNLHLLMLLLILILGDERCARPLRWMTSCSRRPSS